MKEIIEKYPKIFQDYTGNPGRVNWLDVPNGWLWLVDQLCSYLQWNIDKGYQKQVTCTQVKEKFGGLRFYVNSASLEQFAVIDLVESLSESICQNCGSTGATQHSKYGWISTLCNNCKKHG